MNRVENASSALAAVKVAEYHHTRKTHRMCAEPSDKNPKAPNQLSLAYDVGRDGRSIGLVDWTVFAVGSNDRYIVVKQNPQGNKAVTNYFIVDKREALPTDPVRAVLGRLTQTKFTAKARILHVPQFTKVLISLE